jgi:prepilin-type N-terminal cleavage/methylation domain-containing protein/prepilin-type processing-associated H-X9-DG protein
MKHARSQRPSAIRSGFTLPELLVVVVIIAVLVAIIMPVARSIKARSESSACTYNLRQLGAAVMLWVADRGTGELPPSLQSGGRGWKVELGDYIGATGSSKDRSSVWFCPSSTIRRQGNRDLTDQCTYSANARVLVRQNDPSTAGNSLLRMAAVRDPSRVTVFMDATQRQSGSPGAADAFLYGNSWYYLNNLNQQNSERPIFVGPDQDGDSYRAFPRYRHGGGKARVGGNDNIAGTLNAVFLDGHVESIRKGALLEKHFATTY